MNDYDYEDDFEQYEPSPYNGDDPDEGPLVVDEVDQDWFDDADWDDEEVEILGDEDFIYDDLDAPY